MNFALVLLAVLFTVLPVLGFAFVARRLLGLPFSLLRTLVAGVIAFLLAPPIIRAIGGSTVTGNRDVLPGLWFVLLGVAIALTIGMIFLVVAEALVPSGSLPGPIYVVRGMRKQLRRTRRYAQISRILVRHGLAPYLRGGRRAELATADGRARLARSLRLAFDDGGVTFVKLGQVLSTRRDLLPVEFVDELSRLQDDAAQIPWPEVEQLLRIELGDPDAVFASIDHIPLAAASVAQVHAATLRTGERVVVKVCRPGVRDVVEADLDIVDRIALRLHRSTRWGRAIGTVDLSHGFADALREELDLRIEARNLAAVAAASAARGDTDVRFPTPFDGLSTERVLVMQRLDGLPLAAAGTEERAALARALFDCLLRQVMLDGVFHADPHPGNVVLLTDGRLGMLDFGSVGRIDAGLRASLQRLLVALDRGDPVPFTDALLELIARPDALDEVRLQRELGRFLARYVGAGLAPDVRMFGDLFRIVSDHGLAVPPEIAAVFRALATLEGTLTRLAPGFDVVAEARRFADDQLAARFRPESLRRTAADELAVLLPMLRRLPRHLDRIGTALESGRLAVNVRLLGDDRDRQVAAGLLHQMLITVLAAATGIMAVLMLGLPGGPSITPTVSLYEFFGYCLLVISVILALRVLVLIFRPHRT